MIFCETEDLFAEQIFVSVTSNLILMIFCYCVNWEKRFQDYFRNSTWEIGKSLGYGLLFILFHALSSMSWLNWDPLGSLRMFAALFNLKPSVRAEMRKFLISSMALASLFSKALKGLFSLLLIVSSTRYESGRNSLSIWLGSAMTNEPALVAFALFPLIS